jgi:hypothetical protein
LGIFLVAKVAIIHKKQHFSFGENLLLDDPKKKRLATFTKGFLGKKSPKFVTF